MEDIKNLKTKDQAREILDCLKSELLFKASTLSESLDGFDDLALSYFINELNALNQMANNAMAARKEKNPKRYELVICGWCQGSGMNQDNLICPACGGDGYVPAWLHEHWLTPSV